MSRLIGWKGSECRPSEPAYLGNGVIGFRPSAANPLDEQGRCYRAGFVEQEAKNGIRQLAEIPNPLACQISLGGHLVGLGCHEQTLDLEQAKLVSELAGSNRKGDSVSVRAVHRVYRGVPCLMGVTLEVTPRQEGTISLDVRVPRPKGAFGVESTMATAPGVTRFAGDLRVLWRSEGTGSRCGLCLAAIVDASSPGPAIGAMSSSCHSPVDTLRLTWADLTEGRPIVVHLLAALVTDADHPVPLLEAGRMVQWGGRALGLEKLEAEHVDRWADVWRTCPEIEGDDESQKAIDGSMYHLYASTHPASPRSVPPFGLSSNAYYGHIFWDCETWVYPAVLVQQPGAARSMLEFRLRGLEQAKRRAALFGYDGAMFPWEAAADGSEDTPMWASTGFMEHHVTPDIACAFWQDFCVTGDREFLMRGVWPVLRETGRWIASRVRETDRGYEIQNVIPADEHSFNVNNSAHTNLVSAMALRYAIACAGLIGVDAPKLWSQIAERIVVPRSPDGLILQQDGWTPDHRSKQADTVLAIYPLGAIEDADDIREVVRHHVRIDPGQSCAVAMGDQVNSVVCARTGDRELARLVWDRGWKPYWIEQWDMYAETSQRTNGCFVTGCGGLLQAVLLGFPGLQLDRPGGFARHPVALPAGWTSIVCPRVHLGGRWYRVIADQKMERAELTELEG